MRRIRTALTIVASVLAWGADAAAAPPLWHRSVAIDYQVRADGTADAVETWAVRGDTTAVAHITAQQTYSFTTDLDDVLLLDAYTLKADGSRIAVQPGAVMDQAVTTAAAAPQFNATKARTVVFPAVGAGDAVHYTLLRRGKAVLFAGQFTATLQPGYWTYLDHADISVALPPGMALNTEVKGLVEAAPDLRPDGVLVRRWRLASHGSGPVVLDMSSFPDYVALGRAYARRAWPNSQPGPSIRALAAALTRGIDDPREQALRIYRHVATETRYVGTFLNDGRVVPRPAATVLAEGFGDCKDHAALLQAMLAAVGIEAQPALISLRSLYSLPNAAGLGALDHVITYVPSLDLYLDSTAPYAPFGLLPAREYDKPVVLATPDAAQVARTPALPPSLLELETTTEVSIGTDDVVSGTTTTRASGPQGIELRSMAAWIEGRGPQGAASSTLRQLGTPGTGGFSFAPPERDAPAYQVQAQFRLDDALLDGGEAPFPLPSGLGVFGRPGKVLLGAGMTEDGRHVCLPGREAESMTLTLPPGATVRALPTDVTVEAGGARYESRYRIEDGALVVHRAFTVSASRVSCSALEYGAMRPALTAARRDQRVQVALVRVE